MKRWILISLLFLQAVLGWSQETPSLLSRVLAANTAETLQAGFTEIRHTPLLEENLLSEGVVYLKAPDKLRWELRAPEARVSVLGAPSGHRFRLPTEKDFACKVLENEELSLILTPLRRDLKQLFTQLVVTVDPQTLQLRSVLANTSDGGWISLQFRDVKTGLELSDSLFE